MTRILIIEDHENLRSSLSSYLSEEGYAVDAAKDMAEGRAMIDTQPDLIVLDWMLPDGQGLDLLREMRGRGLTTPVIFLTARAEVIDRVLGLEMGADDYLTKPFEPRELMARVRARLRDRRVGPALVADTVSATDAIRTTLAVGALTIDRIRHKVTFRHRTLDLVKKEFDLLCLFAESPEKVFSREEILNKVWGYENFPTTRTVDTHVMLLRQKIHPDLIETVRAVGYRFKIP
jgi:DNA-binding response OmpR family regulator